jgi:hypothetical protein
MTMPAVARARGRSGRADGPAIVELAAQRVAVVETEGDPSTVGATAIPALYGAVYGLKFALKKKGRDFKVGALRARWPDAERAPKARWRGLWALPVPDEVETLAPKDPGVPLRLETWSYGSVAQVLHHGSYADEAPTIARLRAFVAEQGYEIAGPHEEEYLTRPDAKDPRTLIRYPVRRASV